MQSGSANRAVGTVSVQLVAGTRHTVAISYSIDGLQASSSGQMSIAQDTSCNPGQDHPPSQVGGPWNQATYTATAQGVANGYVTIPLQVGRSGVWSALIGKAFIVSPSGPGSQPLACGILASTSSQDDSSSDGHLADWKIALIVIGCCLGVFVLTLIVLWLVVIRKRAQHQAGQGVEDGVIMTDFYDAKSGSNGHVTGNTTPPSRPDMGTQGVIELRDEDNHLNKNIPVYTLPPVSTNTVTSPPDINY